MSHKKFENPRWSNVILGATLPHLLCQPGESNGQTSCFLLCKSKPIALPFYLVGVSPVGLNAYCVHKEVNTSARLLEFVVLHRADKIVLWVRTVDGGHHKCEIGDHYNCQSTDPHTHHFKNP